MCGTWVQHWAHQGAASHLIPIGDTIKHQPDAYCECAPALVMDGQELTWMHHMIRSK